MKKYSFLLLLFSSCSLFKNESKEIEAMISQYDHSSEAVCLEFSGKARIESEDQKVVVTIETLYKDNSLTFEVRPPLSDPITFDFKMTKSGFQPSEESLNFLRTQVVKTDTALVRATLTLWKDWLNYLALHRGLLFDRENLKRATKLKKLGRDYQLSRSNYLLDLKLSGVLPATQTEGLSKYSNVEMHYYKNKQKFFSIKTFINRCYDPFVE